MDRKEFLSLLGIGAAGMVIPSCLGGCSKDSTSSTPSGVNFTLNSTQVNNLKAGASYTDSGTGILVVYVGGSYYAVYSVCPHEYGTLAYSSSLGRFQCTKHTDQNFTTEGASNKAKTSSNIKTYICTYNSTANTLTVTG